MAKTRFLGPEYKGHKMYIGSTRGKGLETRNLTAQFIISNESPTATMAVLRCSHGSIPDNKCYGAGDEAGIPCMADKQTSNYRRLTYT